MSATVGGMPTTTFPDHAAAVPLEQAGLQLFLEQPNLSTERRLRDAESVGGFAKTPKFGDMDQGTELGKVHNLSQSVISDHKQFVIRDESRRP